MPPIQPVQSRAMSPSAEKTGVAEQRPTWTRAAPEKKPTEKTRHDRMVPPGGAGNPADAPAGRAPQSTPAHAPPHGIPNAGALAAGAQGPQHAAPQFVPLFGAFGPGGLPQAAHPQQPPPNQALYQAAHGQLNHLMNQMQQEKADIQNAQVLANMRAVAKRTMDLQF